MAKKSGLTEFSKQELLAELAKRQADEGFEEGMTLAEMEQGIERWKYQAGAPTLAEMLRRRKPETAAAKPCPKCGKRVRVKVKARERQVTTLSGSVTLKRNYHYCGDCQLGFYPLDAVLGLAEDGELSPEMEKRVLDFGVNDVFAEIPKRWSTHYPFAISDNMARGVVERVGEACEGADPVILQKELRSEEPSGARTLYVMADGSMLLTREADPWKEAKVGVVFRAEHHARGTAERRGQILGARYVATMGDVDDFSRQLKAALAGEDSKAAQQLVWLGDGAAWIWNLAGKLALGCIEILDWGHAVEHGMAFARAVFGEGNPWLPKWKERLEHLLYEGNNDQLVGELMGCLEHLPDGGLKALDDLVRYYRNNANRMRYREYRERGLLIGSGTVESAHRHVLQVRMKRAGQHWSLPRANQMVRLRAAYRTNPDSYRDAIRRAHWRTRAEPRKQRATTRRRASNR